MKCRSIPAKLIILAAYYISMTVVKPVINGREILRFIQESWGKDENPPIVSVAGMTNKICVSPAIDKLSLTVTKGF